MASSFLSFFRKTKNKLKVAIGCAFLCRRRRLGLWLRRVFAAAAVQVVVTLLLLCNCSLSFGTGHDPGCCCCVPHREEEEEEEGGRVKEKKETVDE